MECEFCNGARKVEELTEKEVIELDDAIKHFICAKHINEILDRIARGEL